MHTRLLDMLHDTANDHFLAVTDRININLGRIVQKTIEQHWRIIRHLDGFAHVALKLTLLMNDFHGTTTQHIGRTHYQRITDLICSHQRLRRAARSAVGRLSELDLVQ